MYHSFRLCYRRPEQLANAAGDIDAFLASIGKHAGRHGCAHHVARDGITDDGSRVTGQRPYGSDPGVPDADVDADADSSAGR